MHFINTIILFTFSGMILAAPLPQSEIDRYNALLSFLGNEQVSVRIIAGETNDETGKVTSLDTETQIINDEGVDISMSIGLERKNPEQVEFRGGLSGLVTEKPISQAQIIAALAAAHPVILYINNQKRYFADLEHTTNRKETSLFLTIKALEEEQILSEFDISVTIPRKTKILSSNIRGLLNSEKELFVILQELIKKSYQAY